jgi:deazaflavin-dependent oxidoreductase (nitroreductase family)
MAEVEDRFARNRKVIEEFRANAGKIPGRDSGFPLLLLTTTGAKSGQQRTTPVAYLADGDRVVVFASKGGGPTSPDWYHNLVANPRVSVEVGSESYGARAVVAAGEERERLYARQAQLFPVFGEYQQKTTRKIPVVILERLPAGRSR